MAFSIDLTICLYFGSADFSFVWLDDDEVTGDWNKYIFHTDDDDDMKEKAFQDASNDECGAYNFMTAFDLVADDFEESIKE